MNYSLSQLRVFQKVVELQSVTKAAIELHLSQPAVSVQLKNFQSNFEIPLTEVVGRQLFVTDFGKEIAATVNSILDQLYVLDGQADVHRGQLSGRLKIATASTGQYVLPYFLTDFVKTNPGVDLEVDVTNKSSVIESLKINQVDIALVSIIPPELQVNQFDLLPNKLFLVGNADNAHQEKEAADLLGELPLIYREMGSGTRLTMERFLTEGRIAVRKRMQLTSNEAVKQAVLAGLGYSIMPLIGLKNQLAQGDLQIVPMKGLPIETTWSLIWLKNKKLPIVAEALLKHLELEREDIVSREFGWFEAYQ